MKRTRLLKGSNQHIRRHKGLKRSTWESILFFLALAFFFLALSHFLGNLKMKFTFEVGSNKAQAEELKPAAIEGGVKVQPATITMPEPVLSLDEIVRRVSILESNAGANTNPHALHNVCADRGGSNIYGYGGMALMICFDTAEEATARVKRWFQEHFDEGMSLRESLCYYNLGIRTETCEYAENFMTKGGE